MFEENRPTNERREGTSYIGTRILIVAGAGMLLSFGLCGVSAVYGNFPSSGSIAAFGAGAFLLSLAALVIGVIVLVIELIARR